MKHKSKSTEDYLQVICPTCAAFKGKHCRHTSKSKRGKVRAEPHDDRIKLAKVKVSNKVKKNLDSVEDKPKKNPHEKLTPEQKVTLKTILDKITVLGRHAEFVGPVSSGPLLETYRVFPLKHTKVQHLEAMSKDFAVALGAESVLVKRMPGESAVGIFVPKGKRETVVFSDTLINVKDFMKEKTDDGHLQIPINLGIDSNGEPAVDDLTTQPHILSAGATGSGKSTSLHAIVLSMLWSLTPDQLKMFISDTKGVEFMKFKHVPHLLKPIAVNVYQTMEGFAYCIDETQKRLDKFAKIEVKNIHEYNARQLPAGRMPYIVIVVDELADVIAEGPEVDKADAKSNATKLGTIVARSRASGIHVIAATQRPSVNIVKGSIKANFPSRLAFKMTGQQDSRTVLNTKGAENLMKKGDALYQSATSSDLRRIHAPLTTLDELKSTVESIIQMHSHEVTIQDVLGKEKVAEYTN